MQATQLSEVLATFPQGSLLFPRAIFQFRSADDRLVTASPAQSFWVCNSQESQRANAVIKIARSGKGMGYAHAFTLADAHQYFKA